MDKIISVAIDGPSAAGKSSVSKIIAKKLNLTYIDTGSMYRAFTYYALLKQVSYDDLEGINNLLKDVIIDFKDNKIYLNNEDVSNKIRTEEIDIAASKYAVIKEVREKMVSLQREMAKKASVIMEGRDITSVVLKDATFKFFLDAKVDERANRRFVQNKVKDENIKYNDIFNVIKERDRIDSTRDIDPLTKTDDSIYIDSTNMSEFEVVDYIINTIKGEK